MFTHNIQHIYKDSSGAPIVGSEQVQADSELNFDGVIPHSSTLLEVDWSCTQANLKSLMIESDHALTIYTNAVPAGQQDTIAIAAGQCLIWSLAVDGLLRCPVSDDVTKLFVTNASGTLDATLKIRALADQTP